MSKKIPIIFLASLALLFFGARGNAQTEITSIHLDSATIERGYTVAVPDRSLLIGIPPGALTQAARVEIRQRPAFEGQLADKHATSKIFEINVWPAAAVQGELFFALRETGSSTNFTQVYLQPFGENEWQVLKSNRSEDKTTYRGKFKSAGTKLAVFEEFIPDLSVAAQIYSSGQASIVLDSHSGEILASRNANETRPIASLTKLMTALLVLETKPDWSKTITFNSSDMVGGSSLPARVGDQISVRDLFLSTLIASNNNSARALARSTGMSPDAFVGGMNQKARQLGLQDTSFVEPSGLDKRNVSTARDIAQLSRIALKHFEFLEATTLPHYTVKLKNRDKGFYLENTNRLLHSNLYITGGKTGYTHEAGYNLMTQAKQGEKEVIAVVLGSPQGKHFEETEILLRAALNKN